MALYFIKDTTLTGIADAIRSKTGSTDGISVTDMASKISSIETGGANVSVETETLLEEAPLSFALNSDLGKYIHTITEPSFTLEVDKTYIVTVDGKEFVRTARETTVNSDTVIFVGDGRLISESLAYTNETFCLWYNTNSNTINIASPTEDNNHIVYIRKIVEGDNSGGGTASLVIATGSFESTGTNVVTHGMGTIPLLICVYSALTRTEYAALGTSGRLLNTTAVSPIFLGSATSDMFTLAAQTATMGSTPYDFTKDYTENDDPGFRGLIRSVNTQTFTVGGSIPTYSGGTYRWIAIGYAPA